MKISYCEVPQGQADPEVMYQSHEVNEDLVYSSEASLPFLMQKKKNFHEYISMEDGSLPDKRHTDRLILFSCSFGTLHPICKGTENFKAPLLTFLRLYNYLCISPSAPQLWVLPQTKQSLQFPNQQTSAHS